MLSIPGDAGATCDGWSRREFLRVGGAGILAFRWPTLCGCRRRAGPPGPEQNANGWGQAKSVIMLFLQGGPSHIDIWDPKPDAPFEYPWRVQTD